MNMSRSFVFKVYTMVSDPTTDGIISWKVDGKSVLIWDSHTFEKQVIPQYFNHRYISSFTRQMNTYGFKKNHNEGEGVQEFSHPCFYRHSKELHKICRKEQQSRKVKDNEVLDALQHLIVRQNQTERLLSEVENELNVTKNALNSLVHQKALQKRTRYEAGSHCPPSKRFKTTQPIPMTFDELLEEIPKLDVPLMPYHSNSCHPNSLNAWMKPK